MISDLTTTKLIGILTDVGDWIFVAGLAIAPIMIVIGAVLFMLGGNNPNRLAAAKKIFIWTAIGFTLTLMAKGVFTILRSILDV